MGLTKEGYDLLRVSGMFWELFPDCSGIYESDKHIIEIWMKDRNPIPDCEYQD